MTSAPAADPVGKEAWVAIGTGSGEEIKKVEIILTAPLGLVAKSQLRGWFNLDHINRKQL